jgi:hypothetical protein
MRKATCRSTPQERSVPQKRSSLRQANAHTFHQSDDARPAHRRIQHRDRVPRKKRRQYTRWTEDEVRVLKEGVRVFGRGKWQQILDWGMEFNNRSAVDLKDKWRTLNR